MEHQGSLKNTQPCAPILLRHRDPEPPRIGDGSMESVWKRRIALALCPVACVKARTQPLDRGNDRLLLGAEREVHQAS